MMYPARKRETDREFMRLWRLAFPEKNRANQKRYDQSIRGRARRDRANKSSKGRARLRRWQQSEKGIYWRRRWTKTPAAHARDKRYRQSPKGRDNYRHHCALRRARKRNAFVPGAETAIKAVEARRDWYISQGWDVEIDHIFALGFGWHEPANMQILHAEDNRKKGAGEPYYRPIVIFN